MSIRLSHSKANKFKTCARQYELHYEKRIRSRIFGSPLWFGLALDEAINRLLIDKKKTLTTEELELKKQTVIEVFDYYMKNATVNGEAILIQEYPYIQYGKADFDSSLLTEADFEELGEDKAFCEAHIEWYHSEKKKKNSELSDSETAMFNQINWYSLYRKGLMILESYEAEIMPQIHEVFSIQKAISLPNESGDEIIGYIDFICSFVDAPDTKVIVDNKSSSKPYKQQDLDESDQLCTYSEAENIPDICFVYEKNIRKTTRTGPRCRITVWRGKASENHIEKTFDSYVETLHSIKEGVFKPDLDSGCFQFGRPCIYKSICHHDTMDDNLVALNKEKK